MQLYGPTNFSPVIQQTAQMARQAGRSVVIQKRNRKFKNLILIDFLVMADFLYY